MRTDPTTLAALAKVRPGADGTFYVDKDRHPNVYRYATTTRHRALHDNLWRDGYTFYGDEMEKALTTIYGVTTDSRSIHTSLAYALPDPWMLTGHREEELGDDFFLLWSRVKPRELDKAIPLVNSHVPARTRELLRWLGDGPLSVPDPVQPMFKADPVNTATWSRVLGRRLRFGARPTFSFDRTLSEYLTAVTVSDLYEFMDAGAAIDQSAGAGSLQMQLAELRGKNTRERRALSVLSVAYPALDVDEMVDYPRMATFVEEQDSTGHATVAPSVPLDLEKFEAALEGTEGFSVGALRERLALTLEPEVFLGRKLLPEQKRMWDATVERCESADDWLPAILRTEATVGEVDTVIGWMDDYVRLGPDIPGARSWVDFVFFRKDEFFQEDAFSARTSREVHAEEPPVRTLCRLIAAGVSFDETRALAHQGFTVAEMFEVLVNDMPAEYVVAMRPPTAVAPF